MSCCLRPSSRVSSAVWEGATRCGRCLAIAVSMRVSCIHDHTAQSVVHPCIHNNCSLISTGCTTRHKTTSVIPTSRQPHWRHCARAYSRIRFSPRPPARPTPYFITTRRPPFLSHTGPYLSQCRLRPQGCGVLLSLCVCPSQKMSSCHILPNQHSSVSLAASALCIALCLGSLAPMSTINQLASITHRRGPPPLPRHSAPFPLPKKG